MSGNATTKIPEFTELAKGAEIVFVRDAQAWIPYPGGDLSDLFPARAVLNKPVKFETRIGMRSRDIDFEIKEQFTPTRE